MRLCRSTPLRLTAAERALLKLLEGALKVSEYTDKVDVSSSSYGGYSYGFSSTFYSAGSVSKKPDLMRLELQNFASLLSGMVVVQDYKTGKRVRVERAPLVLASPLPSLAFQSKLVRNSIEENAEFFQRIFEIGRRFKIMNPDKMRTTYGKLMHILQDAQSPNMLSFNVVVPIKTVFKLLQKRIGARALLCDPDLVLAMRALDSSSSPEEHAAAVKEKREARQRLVERYCGADAPGIARLSNEQQPKKAKLADGDAVNSAPDVADEMTSSGSGMFASVGTRISSLWSGKKAGDAEALDDDRAADGKPPMTEDELLLVIDSLSDGMAHQAACRKPVLEMLEWLESMFSPDRPESDQVDLAIQNGAGGSHLTHSHSTQYQFVRQSLMLWAEIQKDIFRLWVAADA